MSYLNERAEILKAELEFAEELHRDNPTTLQETYKQDAENAVKARKIAEMLEQKKNEIDEFLFFHPEYTEVFA